jgi:preprotein translocase subunit SecE
MITAIKQYLIDAVAEMRKVVWPTKSQTINYTVLVIALTIGMALFISALDSLFSLGLKTLIQ